MDAPSGEYEKLRDSIKTEVQSGGHCLSTWFSEELSLCARVHVRCTTPCCARSFAGIKLRGTVEISAISFLSWVLRTSQVIFWRLLDRFFTPIVSIQSYD